MNIPDNLDIETLSANIESWAEMYAENECDVAKMLSERFNLT